MIKAEILFNKVLLRFQIYISYIKIKLLLTHINMRNIIMIIQLKIHIIWSYPTRVIIYIRISLQCTL